MPLPNEPNMVWPPVSKEAAKYAEWSAWYSGDPERLIDVYGGLSASQTPDARVINPVPWWRFWTRVKRPSAGNQGHALLHVPLPGDLAAVNGALLFSEEPRVTIKEAHEGATPSSVAKETERRLLEIMEDGGAYNTLIEGAETAAAMGGVFLRPVWDRAIAGFPFLATAQVDQAVPVFRWKQLVSVIFWRQIRQDGTQVIRHLESHEVIDGKAFIFHGLFKGGARTLGDRMALNSFPETANLEEVVELPFDSLDVQYIPNMRPNRLWRSSPLGISDYSGSEGLFDALDETYASWMRDIRLAKGRVMVPSEYLSNIGTFDVDHEVFTPLQMEPAAAQSGVKSIEVTQFDIRVEQHLKTALEFTERVVSNAGYSPQTFGLHIEGRAESGTALRIRENRTFLTQKRKGHWWRPAVARALQQVLILDREQFNTEGIDADLLPQVYLADSIINDPVELSQTLNTLKSAMAASTETRVRMLHPEWTADQVKKEVDTIVEEEQIGPMAAPELPGIGTGGGPGGGTGEETGESTGETGA